MHFGAVLVQPIAQNLRPIVRLPAPEPVDSLSHFRHYAMRVGQARMRSILKPFDTPCPESLELLVPGLFADSKLITDICDSLLPIETSLDECQLLGHG